MSEKMNYFQAIGKAVGTDRRVRLEDGEWFYVNMSPAGYVVLTTEFCEGEVKTDLTFNPSVNEKLSEEWEVEPEKIHDMLLIVHRVTKDKCRLSLSYRKGLKAITRSSVFPFALNDLTGKRVTCKYRLVPIEEEGEDAV